MNFFVDFDPMLYILLYIPEHFPNTVIIIKSCINPIPPPRNDTLGLDYCVAVSRQRRHTGTTCINARQRRHTGTKLLCLQSPDRDDTLGPPGDGEPVQGSDTVQHNQVTMHSHFIVTTLRTLYAALQYWSFLSYCMSFCTKLFVPTRAPFPRSTSTSYF